MFNLEQAIAEWRRQMLAAGIKFPVPLEELELHLREDIAQRMESGSSAEESLSLAVTAIGSAAVMKEEFETADASRKAIWQSLKRWGSVVCLGLFIWLVRTKHRNLGQEAVMLLLPMAIIVLLCWDQAVVQLREKIKTSGRLRGLWMSMIGGGWAWLLFRSQPNALETIAGLGLIGAIVTLLYHFDLLKRYLTARCRTARSLRLLRETGLAVSAALAMAGILAKLWCQTTGQGEVLFCIAMFFAMVAGLFYDLNKDIERMAQIKDS